MGRIIKQLRKVDVVKSAKTIDNISDKERILSELAKHSSPIQSKIIAKNLDILHHSTCIVLEVLYREGIVTTNGMSGQYKKWELLARARARAIQEEEK